MRSSAKQARKRTGKNATRLRRGQGEPRARVRLDVDERRTQLVELGLAEFGSRTYDEVSIDLIAQMAGISKGLLYHYFPTKRAFYVACVREACSRLVARLEIEIDAPPLERLRMGLDHYLEYVRAHGRPYATLMRSGVGADREIAAVVDETRATLLSGLTSGMANIFPAASGMLSSPLLKIALHGWIGLAEAASIAWVEACLEDEEKKGSRVSSAPTPTPTAAELRDLLTQTLIAIVQSVVRTPA